MMTPGIEEKKPRNTTDISEVELVRTVIRVIYFVPWPSRFQDSIHPEEDHLFLIDS